MYYEVHLVVKALHCKAMYIINLQLDPTLIGTGDLVPLSKLAKAVDIDMCTRKQAISIELSTEPSFAHTYTQQNHNICQKLY